MKKTIWASRDLDDDSNRVCFWGKEPRRSSTGVFNPATGNVAKIVHLNQCDDVDRIFDLLGFDLEPGELTELSVKAQVYVFPTFKDTAAKLLRKLKGQGPKPIKELTALLTDLVEAD